MLNTKLSFERNKTHYNDSTFEDIQFKFVLKGEMQKF